MENSILNGEPVGSILMTILAIISIATICSALNTYVLHVWFKYKVRRDRKKELKLQRLREFHEKSMVNKPISEIDPSINQNAFGSMIE